jgi:hypothetical protein
MEFNGEIHPKEKAKELILKFWNEEIKTSYIKDGVINIQSKQHLYEKDARKFALIVAEEFLKESKMNDLEIVVAEKEKIMRTLIEVPCKYWTEVKKEIQNYSFK